MVVQSEVGTTVWTIDPAHTDVGFSVKHMMITTVRGRFSGVSGRIELDEERPERSSVDVTIEAASITTGTPDRDNHLRSGDFLDVASWPELTYRSREVEATGEGSWRVTGDLTLHGVTKEVVLEVTEEGRGRDPWGGTRASFSATTKIDRRDFGLTWNAALETGGVLVENDVGISLEVQAVLAEG
jgi:polyisoprenoid-binding protein YceI